jgi:lysozyme family protein
MSTFDQAFAFTVGIETDELTDDPNDRGGKTRYGISQAANPDIDVANLTEEGAKAVYRKRYWDPIKGDSLPPALACMTFDAAVNQGVEAGSKFLQRAVGTTDDGVIGAITIAKAKDSAETIAEFTVNRFIGYAALDQFQHFGKGWTRRVIQCHDFAKSILKGDV